MNTLITTMKNRYLDDPFLLFDPDAKLMSPFDTVLVKPPMYSCRNLFSFSNLSWSDLTSSMRSAKAARED